MVTIDYAELKGANRAEVHVLTTDDALACRIALEHFGLSEAFDVSPTRANDGGSTYVDIIFE